MANTSFSFSLSQTTHLFSSLSLRGPIHDAVNTPNSACSMRFSCRNVDGRFAIQASKEDDIQPIPNVIFEPLEEVKQKPLVIPTKPQASLARQQYSEHCEDALHEQIKQLANENDDGQLTDFIESEFLADQVEPIRKISEYVAQLRRLGKGHGIWHLDQMLLKEAVAA